MKKFYLSLIVFCLFSFRTAFGQTYELTVTSAPFQFLQNGTPAVTGVWDDPGFTLPLGFQFEFFGESTSTLYAIDQFVGGLLAANLDVNSLNILLPFATDLIDRGYDSNTPMSPITYATTGAAGNRVFTLEYENAGFYSGEVGLDGNRIDNISLQMRIYEATGNIEVHIGPYDISNAPLDFEAPGPQIGFVEDFDFVAGTVDGEVMLLSGNPLNPSIVTDSLAAFVNWPIPENTVYRFSTGVTAVDDIVKVKKEAFYYPNPAKDMISLKSSFSSSVVAPVRIFNTLGEMIMLDDEPATIDISSLAPGMYHLNFETADGLVMEKISITR